jgi:hypothetical protein
MTRQRAVGMPNQRSGAFVSSLHGALLRAEVPGKEHLTMSRTLASNRPAEAPHPAQRDIVQHGR